MQTATRYHDISCGHRVVGHESKCSNLHGHNYRIFFTCAARELDQIGRVVDFGIIKQLLCTYLEETWDHKLLLWEQDPMLKLLSALPANTMQEIESAAIIQGSIVEVPFNPTAENMAQWLLDKGNRILHLKGFKDIYVIAVAVQETRKCTATATSETVFHLVVADDEEGE